MDFLNGQTATNFVIAVAVVGFALIAYAGVLKYLRERPVSPLMAITGRERAKRLSVIDAAVVDARRRVVLIRRDNVEHLVLIGGPTDVVIESRIGLEETTAASAAAAATAALQRRAEPTEVAAEAPQRQAQQRQAPQRQAQPARPQPVAAPANNWDQEQPSEDVEDDTYNYGPNAAFDAKDYPPQPQVQGYRQEPAAPAPAQDAGKQSAAAVAEANAESIIEMLRSRILNDAATTASMQAARQADASRRQVSTFERLLSERMQANDRQAASTPRSAQRTPVQPMPGVGPATARASAAAAQQLPVAREIAPEKPRSEVALEMEVARILEELQTRRKQKQNP
ncbi:flagellar biosynthetic protein FliO [Rhizobium sp. C4]|uniref:flagellar biosynthetic protein FliO n=1 Tax=Rhizobium sp. C4 TaxID=1349800 RepID=UPI001E64F553|nr:flagellar biosynthetic protein FliO [Rhizobium sp. C4]MCD2171567.1 flagellar biosynthetic protein FliO [Rhizobium sp. C4]